MWCLNTWKLTDCYMSDSTNELIFVATEVTRETHRALRIEAAKNGLPLKGYIRKVLEEVTNDE